MGFLYRYPPRAMETEGSLSTVPEVIDTGAVMVTADNLNTFVSERQALRAAAEAARAGQAPRVAFEGSTDGELIYTNVCAACHDSGAAGAPMLVAADWTARLPQGEDATLAIYTPSGRLVRSIEIAPGRESVVWNGLDDDGDGEIDEDFGQIGNQMMVATMYDNTRLAAEAFPDRHPGDDLRIDVALVDRSGRTRCVENVSMDLAPAL